MNIERERTNKKRIAKELAHLCKKTEEKFKTESNLKETWNRSSNPTIDLLPEACGYAKRYSISEDIPSDKLNKIKEGHDILSDWFMDRYDFIPAENTNSYKPEFKVEDELYVTPLGTPRSTSPALPNNSNNSNNKNGFVEIGGKRSRKQRKLTKKSKKSRKQKRKNTRKNNRK